MLDFVLQLMAPTKVTITGIGVQGGGGGRKRVQQATPATSTRPRLVRSVGKWGLRTTGDAARDQLLYQDVQLEQDSLALHVSKSLASKQVELVYLEDIVDDCLAKLRLELPEPKSVGGRFPNISVVVEPLKRPGRMAF